MSSQNIPQPNQPIQKSKNKRKIIYIIAVVVIVLIVIFAVGIISLNNEYGSSNSSSPQTYTVTVLPSGTVESLSPGYYYYVNFTIPSSATSASIYGSYTSSADVNVYILTPEQYGAFTQNPGGNGYMWYSGDNQGATISVSLGPGQYSLVFYNSNIITSDTISVVNAITLQYTL